MVQNLTFYMLVPQAFVFCYLVPKVFTIRSRCLLFQVSQVSTLFGIRKDLSYSLSPRMSIEILSWTTFQNGTRYRHNHPPQNSKSINSHASTSYLDTTRSHSKPQWPLILLEELYMSIDLNQYTIPILMDKKKRKLDNPNDTKEKSQLPWIIQAEELTVSYVH